MSDEETTALRVAYAAYYKAAVDDARAPLSYNAWRDRERVSGASRSKDTELTLTPAERKTTIDALLLLKEAHRLRPLSERVDGILVKLGAARPPQQG